MKRILLAWELGGGLGHLYPLRQIGDALRRRGWHVTAAVRHVLDGARVFADSGIELVPAPHRPQNRPLPFQPAISYAQLLANAGFSQPVELQSQLQAWHSLFQQVRPAAVVCDHSPTALLALRGTGIASIAVGTGFFVPPVKGGYLPLLRPWLETDTRELERHEEQLADHVNSVLLTTGLRPLRRLGDIYQEVDESILLTFAELDHFGPRMEGQYSGTLPTGSRREFSFPGKNRKKIFAYLHPFPELQGLIDELAGADASTFIVCPADIRYPVECGNLFWSRSPIDLDKALAECDLVINHAGHGVVAPALLKGKPLLMIPFQLEQFLLARAVKQQGAGLILRADSPQHHFGAAIIEMLNKPMYLRSAKYWGSKNADHDAGQVADLAVDRIERLLL